MANTRFSKLDPKLLRNALSSFERSKTDVPAFCSIEPIAMEDKRPLLDTSGGESDVESLPRIKSGTSLHSGRYYVANVVVLSSSFFLTFTAFTALQALQSSLNDSGKTCLATLYGSLMVSCFITPPLVQRLSPKTTIFLSMLAHAIFTGANYYPKSFSMIPACALLGLASAPLWTAQQTYLTTMAHNYARASGVSESFDSVTNRFNGIFFLIFQASGVSGNLISSLVLRSRSGSDNTSNHIPGSCDLVDSTESVPHSTRYTLMTAFLACNGAGAILCLLRLKKVEEHVSQYIARDWQSALLATLRRMLDWRMLLLIPVTVYSGMEQAYIFGEYTKHFISDCIGISYIGYCMLVLGVVDALSSFVGSRVAKACGRLPLVTAGALVNLGLILFLRMWSRQPITTVIFLIPALWGFVDAVWNTQLNTLFGILFADDQEAAFSNYRLWQSLGFCVAFAYGESFSASVKLTILGSMLVFSFVLYTVVELRKSR